MICRVIKVLFHQSIKLGIFPQCAKFVKIIPLYKSGGKNDPCNYWPISLLSTFSNIFKKLVHVRIYDYLCKFDVENKSQFGFRKSYNTSDVVLELICDVGNCLENSSYLIAVLVDFFVDCVCYVVLAWKLELVGIRGSALKWFASYLSYRKQSVQLKKT